MLANNKRIRINAHMLATSSPDFEAIEILRGAMVTSFLSFPIMAHPLVSSEYLYAYASMGLPCKVSIGTAVWTRSRTSPFAPPSWASNSLVC
jgi:hypothetical protein